MWPAKIRKPYTNFLYTSGIFISQRLSVHSFIFCFFQFLEPIVDGNDIMAAVDETGKITKTYLEVEFVKEWVVKSTKILFTFADITHRYFAKRQGFYNKILKVLTLLIKAMIDMTFFRKILFERLSDFVKVWGINVIFPKKMADSLQCILSLILHGGMGQAGTWFGPASLMPAPQKVCTNLQNFARIRCNLVGAFNYYVDQFLPNCKLDTPPPPPPPPRPPRVTKLDILHTIYPLSR